MRRVDVSCRSPCMDFLPPLGGVFRLSLAGSSPGIPCRRSFDFQGAVLDLAIKKSPRNNLNLTIPSGMALVRVRYVAIRKSKTCSGSFGSRAGTLSKYVILNCWNGLPQKSSHVNVNLSGRGPSILLCKTVLSLKSPTGAFIAALRFANANLSGQGPSILLRKTVLSLKSPTGAFIAPLHCANANF